jgi:hypothetical protein
MLGMALFILFYFVLFYFVFISSLSGTSDYAYAHAHVPPSVEKGLRSPCSQQLGLRNPIHPPVHTRPTTISTTSQRPSFVVYYFVVAFSSSLNQECLLLSYLHDSITTTSHHHIDMPIINPTPSHLASDPSSPAPPATCAERDTPK